MQRIKEIKQIEAQTLHERAKDLEAQLELAQLAQDRTRQKFERRLAKMRHEHEAGDA